METLSSRIVELLQDFVRSREYLSKNQKQKLEMEIQFNSDLSDLRKVIQETEQRKPTIPKKHEEFKHYWPYLDPDYRLYYRLL